jgi:hypothetical protein
MLERSYCPPRTSPCSSVIMSSISNISVALDMQPLDIIDPIGIIMVKKPVLPLTVPLTIMGLPKPASSIVPENADPVWVTCHVVVPALERRT